MSTSLDLAQRLEAARRARGLTRKALTEQAGVSRQAVYRLFKGDDVQVSTLLAVMDVLELDLATVPRTLQRGLPELGTADTSVYARGRPVSALIASEPDRPATHVLSAVQQRLAGLQQRAVAPKVPKGRK
ncbi:MAG: helix-turn-helix transcriptional regulator [Pseudomonadota bacterium]